MASATLTAASIHPSSSFSAAPSATMHQGPHQPSSTSLPQQQSTQPPPPSQQQHQQLPPSSATMAAPISSLQPSSQPHSQPSSQQSFGTSQPSGLPSAPWRQYNDPKGPQIYLAIYSGVEVYEMEVNAVALMRRRKDSWLNATQILKVAGVDKGKRTKILEKEIQTGEHEKVQGGYGKYQGTWIKFERGVEVCRQYGVEELVRPLLTYDMGQDGSQAGHGDFNTPTKEQAMAAQRKRMYTQATELRAAGQPGTTFFRNISSTASHALSAINKARFDSPGPRGRGNLSKAPSFSRQPSMQGDDFPTNSQQSYVSDYGNDFAASQQTQDGLEPPRKRQRVVTPADSFGGYNQSSADMYANQFPGSPTEPNESFVYAQAGISIHPEHDGTAPLPPLPMDMSPEAQQKRSVLMGLFMDPNTTDPAKYADVLRSLSPTDLDMPIDNFCHTALHWAATLSRTALLRALISAGASPYRVNASGETPLIRAATVTNSMEYSTFPDLLDALGGTIDIRDGKGRTVLHHIAVSSAVKGRNAASKYYLESLLEWVVRQGSGSVPNSQTATMNGGAPSGIVPKMNIGRFMSEIVNAQDNSGDTALNIAARIGNRSIIYQLLEVGADPNIANRAGLRPLDFGIGTDVGDGVNGDANADKNAAGNQKSKESSNDIVTSITHLLSETSSSFQDELKSKQQSVDSITAQIRTTSAQVAEARRKLEQMQAKLRAQQLARQRVLNFSRANPEEQFRLKDLERKHPKADPNTVLNWDKELAAGIEREQDTIPSSQGETSASGSSLPPAAELRARIKALKAKIDMTQRQTSTLQVRSRDAELKYRKVVSLCTGVAEGEVESVVDGLLRAVESEKGELELGRVRRFLGGVETVC